MNKTFAISKLNLRQIRAAYIITGIVFILLLASYVLIILIPGSGGGSSGGGSSNDNSTVSAGNALVLLPIFAAIFIPAKNLRKTINLGVRRIDFFKGCIPIYVILSAAVSFVVILFHYAVDPFMSNHFGVLDMSAAFGFLSRGFGVAFVQMFAFLLLASAFAHTLSLAQGAWYGWLADAVLIAIICVFTPIPFLRAAEVWFFNLIIFGNPGLQIAACVVIAAALYALSRPVLNRRRL